MNEQKAIKVYVQVAAVFTEDGLMLPRYLVWEDGVKYKIDRVGDIKQAAAMRCGGQGDRYTVWIGGRQSYMFFERSAAVTVESLPPEMPSTARVNPCSRARSRMAWTRLSRAFAASN